MNDPRIAVLGVDEWPDEANSWHHCGAKYVNPMVDATCQLEPGHEGNHEWFVGNLGLAWNKSAAWKVER